MQAYNVVNLDIFIYLLVRVCVNSEIMVPGPYQPHTQLNATEVTKQVLMGKSNEFSFMTGDHYFILIFLAFKKYFI